MRSLEFKNNNFDSIRLIAALQVLLYHGYEHFDLHVGSLFFDVLSLFPGVPVFFVTSGFLIASSLERSDSLFNYFTNRALRIYPALWGCFIFSIFTVLMFSDTKATSFEIFPWVIAQLSFLQVYNPDFLREYGIGVLNGSLWTIPIELQFYALLPILFIFLERVNWNRYCLSSFLLILILANLVYSMNILNFNENLLKILGVTIVPYLYMFFFGIIMYKNFWFIERYLIGRFYLLFIVYIVSLSLSKYLGFPYLGNHMNPVLMLLLGGLTLSFAYSKEFIMQKFILGRDISYGVYIYHMVIINIFVNTQSKMNHFDLFLMIIITIFLSSLSWIYIEKPCLAIKGKIFNSLKKNK